MRIAVFAYGSLVDPGSASATLGREVERTIPARLTGWRRRWSQARDNLSCEKTFALAASGELPPYVLGLNVERIERRSPDLEGHRLQTESLNGALIEVDAEELDRLDVREIRYRRVEVAESIEVADGELRFDSVVAYSARTEHFAPSPPEGAVILASYAAVVESAFSALGSGEIDVYRQTTAPHPVPVVEAELVRDRIPAGNPRAW